jgi:hypothetical protein
LGERPRPPVRANIHVGVEDPLRERVHDLLATVLAALFSLLLSFPNDTLHLDPPRNGIRPNLVEPLAPISDAIATSHLGQEYCGFCGFALTQEDTVLSLIVCPVLQEFAADWCDSRIVAAAPPPARHRGEGR